MLRVTTTDGKTYTVSESMVPFYIDASQEWVLCEDQTGRPIRINRAHIVSYTEAEEPKKKETKTRKPEAKE